MNNRRKFLGGCAAAATVMAIPAGAAILASPKPADGRAGFEALRGERISLREGGSVVVLDVDSIGVDARWDQSLVKVLPSAPMESGIYHVQTSTGWRALYFEAGGSARRPTLTAAFSRLRA